MRCDSAGATHAFADACRGAGAGFSFGHPVDARVQDAADTLNLGHGWYPAIDTDGGIRDGAWVAEATALVDLSSWPTGTRLILRKERPHPGAQLRFTDVDGIGSPRSSPTPPRVSCRPARRSGAAAPPARPRRGPDSPGEGHRAAELAVPALATPTRRGWKSLLAATDLVAWSKLIGFIEHPDLATLRDRHVPLPGAARRRPDHPRRPPSPTAPRPHLAVGQPDRPPGNDPRRLRLTTRPPTNRPETPPALGKPAPPGDTGRFFVPACDNQPRKPASTGPIRPHKAARKIEASGPTATATYIPEAESLARKGETTTTAAMATYAYDQIDQARAEPNAVSG